MAMASTRQQPSSSNESILQQLRDGTATFELINSPSTNLRFFAKIGSSPSLGGSSPAMKKVQRYSVQKVTGDGRCLFRALVKGMARNKGIPLSPAQEREDADELRMAVKEVICDDNNERTQYEEALVAITVEESLKRYCQRIPRSDFWGGESELLVLSKLCHQPIIVYIPEHEVLKIYTQRVRERSERSVVREEKMAERNSDGPPTPADILRKIKGFVRCLVEHLSENRTLSVALDRYRNYCSDPNSRNCCSCSSDLPYGKEIIFLERESHAHRLDVFLRVLLIVQQLLQENKHGSKRDIYYMHPSVFIEQAVVDRAINDICVLLKCSRHNLNVVPVGRGLVMGWLKFVEAGRAIHCIRNPNTAYPVPVCMEEVEGIVSVAKYILVVEKETVFQRLANDSFCDRNHCIVITGRGYPDVPTRRFLRYLVDQLQLPVYCLVDSDPYGFDILTTYKFGSMTMAYDAKLMRVAEIQWLGVFPSELEKYQVPARCLIQLTNEDKKKAEAMMLRCYLHREAPQWRSELEIMLQKGVKFEIEALSVFSLSFLAEEYIPAKVQSGEYI